VSIDNIDDGTYRYCQPGSVLDPEGLGFTPKISISIKQEVLHMPYTDNDGVRIHYEVKGDGPPLVLQHGLSSNMSRWSAAGFVDALKSDYKIMLIDARGHGDSDKPYDADVYDRKIMASDVIAVLDAEGVDRSHYMGYSMGGSIGFGLAESYPDRFHSLIIGGMHPYPINGLDNLIEMLKGGMEAWVGSMDPQPTPERKKMLLANDPRSITAAALGLRNRPDLSHVLPTMTMPCLVYAGDADDLQVGAEKCVKDMPNVTWASLPGLDHGQAMERSDMVLPHVRSFLSGVAQSATTAD
jgi:pimeloyl-ACP methyl ester carboxylesterase